MLNRVNPRDGNQYRVHFRQWLKALVTLGKNPGFHPSRIAYKNLFHMKNLISEWPKKLQGSISGWLRCFCNRYVDQNAVLVLTLIYNIFDYRLSVRDYSYDIFIIKLW